MTTERTGTERPTDAAADRPTDAAADRPTDAAADPILSARGIAHEYGDHTVLAGIDLDIAPGAVTAVIGPNGTGKTTLLRILLGQLSPTEGTVDYRGPDTDRPIGYLPQQPSFRPRFTAAETVAFYGSLLGIDADPDAALARVGLADAADRRVEALSGGMRRLLGIAQSLVGDPPVVVADEPASGLDPTMGTAAFETLTDRAAAGTAAVVSSHDLSLVERFADQVLLLYDGRLLRQGSPAELCAADDVDSLWDVYEATVGSPPTRAAGESHVARSDRQAEGRQ